MTSDAQILAPRGAGDEGVDPRRWLTLIILLLAAFMNLLDVSIVNIAIPSIQRNLHASYADVQWALAGYTLAYALVLITGGRLGDTFGRKRLFLIGVTGFTIMSALCGAAQSPGELIACRVVQGAMGAIMVPQVLAVIQVIFPPAERIKALAGFGVTAGVPAQYTARIETQFGTCLHDRLIAADPTVTPASCRPSAAEQALPAPAHRVIAAAGGSAVRDDFTASVQRTLWFQVGVFLLAFLFMLALPGGAGRRAAEDSGPGEAVPAPAERITAQ